MTRIGSWVETYTGEQFWPLDPRPEEIHLEDIAHSLSHICRYGGHINRFYSVAEHCVHVSNAVSRENAFWGLMHDAAEAYVGDMVRPLKKHMDEFNLVEAKILGMIAKKFGVADEVWSWEQSDQDILPEEVKETDTRILLTERKALMPNNRHEWGHEHLEPLKVNIIGYRPTIAKTLWLNKFEELSGERP